MDPTGPVAAVQTHPMLFCPWQEQISFLLEMANSHTKVWVLSSFMGEKAGRNIIWRTHNPFNPSINTNK